LASLQSVPESAVAITGVSTEGTIIRVHFSTDAGSNASAHTILARLQTSSTSSQGSTALVQQLDRRVNDARVFAFALETAYIEVVIQRVQHQGSYGTGSPWWPTSSKPSTKLEMFVWGFVMVGMTLLLCSSCCCILVLWRAKAAPHAYGSAVALTAVGASAGDAKPVNAKRPKGAGAQPTQSQTPPAKTAESQNAGDNEVNQRQNQPVRRTAPGTTKRMQHIVDQDSKLSFGHVGAMSYYANFSFEELRYQDYKVQRFHPRPPRESQSGDESEGQQKREVENPAPADKGVSL